MHLRGHSVVVAGHDADERGKGRAAPQRALVRVFDDLLARAGLTGPPVAVALGGALFLLYLIAIRADGFEYRFHYLEFWMGAVEPVAILTYVLLVHTFLNAYGRKAVRSIRPVIDLDDKTFDDLVASMSKAILRNQWIPMVLFAALSIPLTGIEDWSSGFAWSTLVNKTTALLEYAFIGSAMYLMIARNMFFTKLFKQPTNVDIFNPAPVRPMGRWGLSVAAAIMGGVTISALLVGDPQKLLELDHLPMYVLGMIIAVLSFFGSMFSTHRVLLNAKENELSAIRGRLSAMYRELRNVSETGKLQGMEERANTITAWLGYEKRIAEAPEWPYTANTLGGLFATVLLPVIGTVIQQIILWWS